MIVNFDVDSGAFSKLRAAFESVGAENSLPNTAEVVNQTANTVRQMWMNWAMGGDIDGIPRNKLDSRKRGELAQSIKKERLNLLHARVSSSSEIMEKIQQGTPEIRMKDLNSPWLRSKKTRMAENKKGKYPYLIIPFSWITERKKGLGVKNVIPLKIVELLRERKQSFVTVSADNSDKYEENVYGEMIPRAQYQWGGRLSSSEVDDENMSGMVRMWDSSTNGSKYFTFRILSPYSKADWVRKPILPIDVTGAIDRLVQPEFEKAVAEAVKSDIDIMS